MRRPVPFQPIYRAVRKPPPAGIGIDWTDPINRDLRGRWLFNEGSGTRVTDLTGNGNTGTLGSSVTWSAGKFGAALAFPNVNADTNAVTVANSSTVNIVGKMTMACWVYPTISNAFQALIDRSTGSASRQYAMFLSQNGVTKIFLAIGGVGIGDVVVTPNWVVNQWNFIAVTADGTNVRTYVNGVLANTTASAALPTSTSDPLAIGREVLNQFSVNGREDLPAIWAGVKTPAEIARLYAEPCAGIITPRRRLWVGAAAAGGSFNPGWASGATKTIGAVF